MTFDVDRMREALAGGRSGIATLLADHPNPTVRLISEMWSHQTDAESADEVPELMVPASPVPPAEGSSIRRIARLESELQRLGDFTDALAAALGACPRCWGDDPVCPECEGTGTPGSTVPDRALFTRFIAPAVQRLAEERRTRLEHSSLIQQPPVNNGANVTERSQS